MNNIRATRNEIDWNSFLFWVEQAITRLKGSMDALRENIQTSMIWEHKIEINKDSSIVQI